MVEESDTSVSDDPELLHIEYSERVVEHFEEALEDGRVDAGLADTRLLLLTVRTLLRLWQRLSSTTSTDGGSTAFGMILDMYVACGEMDMTAPAEFSVQGTTRVPSPDFSGSTE